MKHVVALTVFLAFASGVSATLYPTGYLPTGTYTADEDFSKIKQTAAEKSRHVLYVRFAPDSKCGKTKAVSMAVARELWSSTVVVYAPAERMKHVPSEVRNAFTKQRCGNYAPWFVIADPKTDALVCVFGYDHYTRNPRFIMNDVRKKMAAAPPSS